MKRSTSRPSTDRWLPALAVMLFLVFGASAGWSQQMRRFTNDRETCPAMLADYYSDFSVSYPSSWIEATHPEESGGFLKVYRTVTYKGWPSYVTDQIVVGPLLVSAQEDEALTLALVQQEAEKFERTQLAGRLKDFKHVSAGPITINGLKAYEIRSQGAGDVEQATSSMGYGRFIFILPTATNDGVLVAMSASSASDSVTGAQDVGERGGLASVLRTLTVPHHAAVDLRSMRAFRSARAQTHPTLQWTFVDFSFRFPRTWALRTSMLDPAPSAFVWVQRGVMHNGVADFSTDLFSVGSLEYAAANDSARRAELVRTVDTIEHQVAASTATFERTSRGAVTIAGLEGIEFRYRATMASRNADGVKYYGRMIVLMPTRTSSGLIIAMQATSLSAGIDGPEDVGVKGDGGEILKSFTLTPRK